MRCCILACVFLRVTRPWIMVGRLSCRSCTGGCSVRSLLGLIVVLARRALSKDAELPVLRVEQGTPSTTPIQAPCANAIYERWIATLRRDTWSCGPANPAWPGVAGRPDTAVAVSRLAILLRWVQAWPAD